MPFHCLTRHSLALPLLFFASFLVLVAAQPTTLPSSLPPPHQASSSNSTPKTTLQIALVSTALFFLVFFTVCILRCVGVPGMSPHCVAAPKGLGADVLGSFPTFVYSGVKEHTVGKGALECAICISEFNDHEMLRLLPKCDHVFHIECIDEWVSGNVTCPVCRADLVPPSGDSSAKGGAADSLQEARDHVEVEIREPNLPMDVSCAESLGFESSDERRVDEVVRDLGKDGGDRGGGGGGEDLDVRSCVLSRAKMREGSSEKVRDRKFPPPIKSLNDRGQPSFFLRALRRDGRLELEEVRIDRPEILRSSRADGRLRLEFVEEKEAGELKEEAEDADETI
ncbi:hypothetical protein MLD38_027762 [Melastoma candidum]|uniref:Uncharacterized protein n=1 Tax=Melastoma candidum TaxID=119954 RepID=A0ACB9P5L5_9MYRT|nr:hypothetical protein MLD38_027762 [Melastoma candidum]